MARIELRDVTVLLKDGLSGTAVLSSNGTANDTSLNIASVNTNASTTCLLPVGARLKFAGETPTPNTTIFTVTARTPSGTGPTLNINITPALAAGSYNSGNGQNAITVINQQIEVKVGEGNVTYSEKKEYEYLRDRGDLDTVKEGDEQPIEVSMEFVYEYVKSYTGEDITPVEAIKGVGAAAEWVSASADLCEPYCVDVVLLHCVPCGSDKDETITLPDFRWEQLDYDLGAATISVSGQCNVSSATITRTDDAECA